MVFPAGGPVPRHPSQLYEAALEGIVLFLVLFVLATRFQARRWPGVLGGTFVAGYGIARILVEFFREPDPQLGFLWGGATMGQLLSLPMVAVGIGAILYARRRKPA
jgi:phosphatidylglycerol:prolipoprotein diacylglycerol transferase